MKKKILFFLFVILLCTAIQMPSFAKGGLPRLVDNADLLTESEERMLCAMLDEISERRQFDVVVVTTGSLEGYTAEEYADDFFDYNGFGYGIDRDGALLLVSMEPGNHNSWISTRGYGLTAFNEAAIDYALDIVTDDHLANGEYREAVEAFASLCDDFVEQARAGSPYGERNLFRESFGIGMLLRWLLIGMLIGVIVAAIRISFMKAKMKSVHMQDSAADYVKRDSLNITGASELFLYRNVSSVRRETTSSSPSRSGGGHSHISSSGASHGGGGRRF